MNKPKVLFFDIETAPNLGLVWGRYEQDVLSIVKDWYILSIAYKWADESKTHVISLRNVGKYNPNKPNDKLLLSKFASVWDEADAVVTHNGDSFDIKKIRTRMAVHGLDPLKPLKQIDTYKMSKKVFGFDSNKLDELGRQLNVGRKVETGGLKTWLGCMSGDTQAWKLMEGYNQQDVTLLEDVYNAIKMWDNTHPNLSILVGTVGVCPKCASKHLTSRGYTYSNLGKSRRKKLVCNNCGGWSSGEIEHIHTV